MKRLAGVVVLALLSPPSASAGQEVQAGKIAIASEGKSMDSAVSDRAGRCKCFLIFDTKGRLEEVAGNPNRDALFDAGRETVQLLARKGVTLVVAANMGARMVEALREKKIHRLELAGTVEAALAGALEEETN